MVAYKDFIESRKLAFGPPALFEFDALISDAAPLDVSLNDIALLNLPARSVSKSALIMLPVDLLSSLEVLKSLLASV